jgi:zinc protease
MLDRTVAPKYHKIHTIDFLKATSQTLQNGIPLHIVDAGEQELIRLEIIFKAGNWFGKQKGQAFFTAKMLLEGTKRLSAYQISEQIDQFGGFLDIISGFDRLNVVLYTPSKFFSELLEIVKNVILEPLFAENELEILKNIQLQELQINLQKDSFLATRKFREILFGEEYPYGQNLQIADIENINSQILLDFHQKYIHFGNCELILSGKVTPTEITILENVLGEQKNLQKSIETPEYSIKTSLSEVFIERPEAVQSAVRLGKILFNAHHPHYFAMLVTNEILGGYFGSRLMQNIREEKGYTYGIYSQIASMEQASYFFVAAEVKREFTQATIDEIKKEIGLLQTELVSEDELELVKNYMAGSMVGSITTAFSQADIFKSIYFSDLGYAYYETYLSKLNAVTTAQVKEMAQTYLALDSFVEVISGGK